MPDCPECNEEMDMEFGNVDFTDGDVLHNFDCPACGHAEKLGTEEMKELGIERPTLEEFVQHFDITLQDISEYFGRDELLRFLQTQAETEEE